MAEALRHNTGKPDLHYLHAWYNALCEVCNVCTKGAEKYARGNYLKGQSMSQLLACAERHTFKYGSPKHSDYDEESGKHHLAHAIWNLLQALENDLDPEMKARFDDRLKAPDGDGKKNAKPLGDNIPFVDPDYEDAAAIHRAKVLRERRCLDCKFFSAQWGVTPCCWCSDLSGPSYWEAKP